MQSSAQIHGISQVIFPLLMEGSVMRSDQVQKGAEKAHRAIGHLVVAG